MRRSSRNEENVRNGYPTIFLVFIQKICHLLYGLVVAGVSASEDDEHTNSVLINELHGLLRVEPIATLLADRHQAALYVEVPGEFLESNLGVRAHDDVGTRLVDRKPLLLASFLPQTLHGEASELDSFGRAGGACAYRSVG